MSLMMVGSGLIVAALLGMLAAVVGAVRGQRRLLLGGLAAATAVTALAAALLMVALVGCDYRLDYVVRHVSNDLPTPYRLAALWAGQEGSILLWVLFVQAVALWLAARREGQGAAAGVVALMGAGLILLMVTRSPFAPVAGAVPEDGHGLNPLLRNPWMLIHPPVLFAGYAVLMAPAALALVALWRNAIEDWLEPARPFLLVGWSLLGAGMMIGGYWAYVTLGWGGFWAWDPVENASLVPWLFATALMHGASLQRRFRAMKRVNLLLAVVTMASMIYGCYLTRSGALDGFSVHSFAAADAVTNGLWLALFVAPLAAGAALLSWRWKRISEGAIPAEHAPMEYSVWLLAAMGAVVLVGTSTPLLAQGGEGVVVDQGFYNRTQGVLFILIGWYLVRYMGAALGMVPIAAAAAGAAVVYKLVPAQGYEESLRLGMLALGAASGATMAVAAVKTANALKARAWRGVGTGLAHAGAGLLVLGAVISGPGAQSQRLVLAPGDSAEALGSQVKLVELDDADPKEVIFRLQVDGGAALKADMLNSSMGVVRRPAVVRRLAGDIYLEPESLVEEGGHSAHDGHDHGMDAMGGATGGGTTLAVDETKDVDGVKVTFKGFEMGAHGDDNMGAMKVDARLAVDTGAGPQEVTAEYIITAEGIESPPVTVGEHTVAVTRVLADTRSVVVEVDGGSAAAGDGHEPEAGSVQLALLVTHKPLISLVWLGSILLCVGALAGLKGPGRR